MNKMQVNGIVIAAGTIVTFLLIRFLRIPPPFGQYVSSESLAYAVIAIVALLRGAAAGGVVGVCGFLLRYAAMRVSPQAILNILPGVVFAGLYGFILGKLFDIKSGKHHTSGDVRLFLYPAVGVYIAVRIMRGIIAVIRYRGEPPVVSAFFKMLPLSIIVGCFVIGAAGLLLIALCHKYLKIPVPLYEGGIVPGTRQEGRKGRQQLMKEAVNRAIQAGGGSRSDSGTWVDRGMAYHQQGELDMAIASLTQAISLEPNAVRYCIRGSMYIDKKDYDKAIEDFSEAISLDPTDPDAYNGRGLAYDHKNETAKAVEDFTQVLRLDPADDTAKKFLAAISFLEGRKY